MGSFSWTRAEATTARANFTDGDRYKILVPEQFGGGYIQDTYFDYGYVFLNDASSYSKYVDGQGNVYPHDKFPCGDLYGILAYWNERPNMTFTGDSYPKTMVDILLCGQTHEQENRCKGIDIGCYDEQVDELKYPLKLVSASYKGSYEECSGKSYGDPNQGFYSAGWADSNYKRYYNKLIQTPFHIISREMIKEGYQKGLVKIIDSPMNDGTVCQIGDKWFYFGGLTAAKCTATEYKNSIPTETIVEEILEALNDISDYVDNNEYKYYAKYLIEKLVKLWCSENG